MMRQLPRIALDFDGVIHAYTSGWQGARVIPDPPVDGALEFLVGALDRFNVAIYSSRSHQWGGRRAMKRWLRQHLIELSPAYADTPGWWRDRIARTAFADPWQDEVKHAAEQVIREIEWPRHKPPALVMLDDRAVTFTGTFPRYDELRHFRPWQVRQAEQR